MSPSASSSRSGTLMAAGAFLAWGLLSPGNEILLQWFSPMWMQAVRAMAALGVLSLWLGPRTMGRGMQLLRRSKLALALALGTFVSFTLFALAQTRIEATQATLGFFAAPIWTALLGRWFLRERVGPYFVPAAALLLLGGAMALGFNTEIDALGMSLALGSGVSWAGYAVMLRRQGADHPWQEVLAASIMLAGPMFLGLALLSEPLPQFSELPWQAWGWTGVQVAIPTLLAIALFQSALQRVPAAWVNLFVGLELIGTVFWAAILLNEVPQGIEWIGLTIVIVAVTGYLAAPKPSLPED